jgi:hypothetical protein
MVLHRKNDRLAFSHSLDRLQTKLTDKLVGALGDVPHAMAFPTGPRRRNPGKGTNLLLGQMFVLHFVLKPSRNPGV